MRKRQIIISALCLLLALPNVGLANTSQEQTPQSINVETGQQVTTEVKSTSITALAEDFTAPVLGSATVDKTSVGVGESFTITASVTDDLSEVARVEAVLVHDGGWKYLPLTLDTETKEWKGTYTIQEYDRAGTWTIEFDMYDALGNYDYDVGPDVEVVNPTGGDTELPTLVTASVSPLNVVANQEINIKAAVNDNLEVGIVRAAIYNLTTTYYVPLTLNQDTKEWESSYSFSEDDLAGSWFVDIDMFDTAGNFSFSENPIVLVLSNPFSDGTGPIIGNPVFSQNSASPGDTVQITVPVSDEQTGVSSVIARVFHTDSPDEAHTVAFGAPGATAGEWVIDLDIDSSFQSGAWNVVIYASDNAGNDEFKEILGAFDVLNEDADITPPVISNVEVTPQGEVQVGNNVTVTAKVTDNVGVDSVFAVLYSQEATESITLSYDEANELWVGSFPIQETTPPGFYRVSVNALDKGFIPSWADAEGGFTVVNPDGDYTGPVISDVQLDKTEVDAGESVTISASVEDADSGVAFVTINYGMDFETINLTYDDTLRKWVGTIPVPTNIPDGEVIKINSIDAVDMVGNLSLPYFEVGSFLVHNPEGDSTAPVVDSLEITPAVARVGDVIEFKAKVTDDKSGVKEVYLWMGNQPEIPLTIDEPSGLWTGSYTVKENDLAGDYPVSVEVGDNNLNSSIYDSGKKVTIDNSGADVTAPVVEAVEISPAEAKVGDTVTIAATLSDAGSGVFSAFARVTSPDSGKSESITLVLNTDTNKWEGTYEVTEFDVPGTWQVDVTAFDVAGNDGSNEEAYQFVVNNPDNGDETAPDQPTVNQVTEKDTAVTGKAEAGSKVEVKANGTVIGSSTAGEDGTFNAVIPVQKAGTELEVTAADNAGNVSTAAKVVVKDVTTPEQPSVNEVTEKDTSVTGKAEAGSKVEVKANGTIIGSATAGADGTFTVTIPVQKAGTELEVTAEDETGNVSAAVKVVVKDVTAPDQPSVNQVTDKDASVTGKAEAGSKIEVKVNGAVIGSGTAGTNGEFTVTIPVQKGGTNLVITAADKAGNVSQGTTVPVKDTTVPGTPTTLVPLIGDTRYETAVEVSKAGWETANSVLLVNAFAIVDGLTATPLASAKNAPILLTVADSIPQSTLDELSRLKTKEIILIGGESVISPKVESMLMAKGYKITRIGGLTRYVTSMLIAKELDKLMDVSTIYVAYGFGEPDALSISAQAGLKKQPIILADKTAVPAETLAWLKNEQLSDAYFIGGEDVIAASILSQIDKIASADVLKNRLSGSDRHETNAKVFSKFYSNVELSSILVTKSETVNLVDALTAGPLAAKLGSPVLLISTSWGLLQSQQQVLAGKQFKHVYQVGGGVNPTALDEVLK
ncbi:Ig-like domain-containing protein [Neobacillus drentensis]|uniref:Ig-like domain-containing protein n=1 Tax=Neobacillus drentensis TaxID=220684 RepID=UPI0030009F69